MLTEEKHEFPGYTISATPLQKVSFAEIATTSIASCGILEIWEQDDGRDKKAKDIEKAERTSRNKFMSLPREGGNQTSSELFSRMSPTAIVSSTDEFQKDASCCLLVDKSSSDNATEDDISAERNRVSIDGTEVGVALPFFITETFQSLHLLHLIDL